MLESIQAANRYVYAPALSYRSTVCIPQANLDTNDNHFTVIVCDIFERLLSFFCFGFCFHSILVMCLIPFKIRLEALFFFFVWSVCDVGCSIRQQNDHMAKHNLMSNKCADNDDYLI